MEEKIVHSCSLIHKTALLPTSSFAACPAYIKAHPAAFFGWLFLCGLLENLVNVLLGAQELSLHNNDLEGTETHCHIGCTQCQM
jgi:hypothetical protein